MTFSYDDETGELVHHGPATVTRMKLYDDSPGTLREIADAYEEDNE